MAKGTERKLRMILVKNDFSDLIEKHMRRCDTKAEAFDVAAAALFVAAGYLGRAKGMKESQTQDALTLASTLLRESKLNG